MDKEQAFRPRQVLTIREEAPFREFFEVRKGTLRFERFDGTMSEEVVRYSFSKWDAVGILVYHRGKDAFLMVRQFRYPPVHHGIDPWMTEIVAGGISPGEEEEAAAAREVEEEVGYVPLTMQRIMRFYVSPGIMSERITLYFAEVDESSRVNDGGGVAHEDEDIEIVPVPRRDALHWLATHDVGDAKTIIALQWADAHWPNGK
jgi:ADP-ribose pyrophosphatase